MKPFARFDSVVTLAVGQWRLAAFGTLAQKVSDWLGETTANEQV